MAITVTAPLSAPINGAGTAVAGGSLDASTTYYFRIVALDVSATGSWGSFPAGGLQSPPSVEFSCATTATDKTINLTWDVVVGASVYDVYYTKTSGSYLDTNFPRCLNGYDSSSDPSQYTTSTNSYTVDREPDTSGNDRGTSRHTFCSTLGVPVGKNLGAISVNFDGTVTLQDIKDQIDTDGYSTYCTYDGYSFILKGSIYITGSNVGAMTCYNKAITFIHGGFENNNVNVVVRFGEKTWAGDSYHYRNGCTFCMCGRGEFEIDNNDHCYDGYFRWPIGVTEAGYGANSPYAFCWGPYSPVFTVRNANVLGFSSNWSVNFYAASSGFTNKKYYDHNVIISANIELSDFTVYFGYITVANYDGTLRDFTHGKGAQDFSMNKSGAGTFKIYNANLYAVDNKPSVWWRSSTTVVINSYYTLALAITDESGVAIVGATIDLKDTDGNTSWSDTTDANGEASEDILSMITSYLTSTTSSYDEKSPFTLTITKAGYRTYTQVITVDEKMDLTVALSQGDTVIYDSQINSQTTIY